MSFSVDPIRSLCKGAKTNLAELERALGFSNGSIAKWETAKKLPPRERLDAVADYFGVSVDYLLGRESPPRQPDTANPAPNSGDGMLDELLSLASRLSEPELQREIAYLRERVAAQDKPVSPPPSAGKTAE